MYIDGNHVKVDTTTMRPEITAALISAGFEVYISNDGAALDAPYIEEDED